MAICGWKRWRPCSRSRNAGWGLQSCRTSCSRAHLLMRRESRRRSPNRGRVQRTNDLRRRLCSSTASECDILAAGTMKITVAASVFLAGAAFPQTTPAPAAVAPPAPNMELYYKLAPDSMPQEGVPKARSRVRSHCPATRIPGLNIRIGFMCLRNTILPFQRV